MSRMLLVAATVWLLSTMATAAFASDASAAFEILNFSGGAFNPDGTSATQAGSHPDSVVTSFEFPAAGFLQPEEQVKQTEVDLPPGFVGNPTATPVRCTPEQLTSSGIPSCPLSSQVGLADIFVALDVGVNGFPVDSWRGVPVYNMVPPRGAPAMFAFVPPPTVIPVLIVPRVRTGGDYGLTARVAGVPQDFPRANGARVTLWGVPADPSHDNDRGYLGFGAGCGSPVADGDPSCFHPVPDAPRHAFLTLPSDCAAGPLVTRMRATSWQHPDDVKTASFDHDTNGNLTAVTGCDRVPFDPAISVQPTSRQVDSPTGLDVELTIPQAGLQSPEGLAQANLKRGKVTLPEGMTISPSSADGLQACSDAQLGLGSAEPSSCPDGSKIGSVSVETPLLEEPIEGGVFVRSQASGDPASGDMFRIAIVAESKQRGIVIKLAGRVAADPETGRLVTTFDDNPQLPFSRLALHLASGPRAPLATPPTCGPKQVDAELSSWSGTVVDRSSTFTLDCPGVSGFAPTFMGGTSDPTAGAFSPLLVGIERDDGQEYLRDVSIQTPPGLIAKLKGVPLCGDAQAAAGTCPLETRIGTATVGAGPGADPFFIEDGAVSLTGPYKGAPYGLSVAVRAVAGPFDLGTVVVRQAIFVDPTDTHLTTASDPIPTIVKGVPLRLRSVRVRIDRPGFTLNPTSCAEQALRASLRSSAGATSLATQRFQAADCQSLPVKPKLRLTLSGRRQTRTGGHPGFRALLTQGRGQANLKRVEVRLPLSLALDPANSASGALCEFADGRQDPPKCPRSSIIGAAKAWSPLLNRPLVGPVYYVKNVRRSRLGNLIRTLPTLVVPLRGEVAVTLRARTNVKGGKLVSTFPTVPDAAVSRFELTLRGGRRGILVVTGGHRLCRGKQSATTLIDAQNGKRADRVVKIGAPCDRGRARSRR